MAVSCIKNRWNSQQVDRKFNNRHRSGLDDSPWSSNCNNSVPYRLYCNEYLKSVSHHRPPIQTPHAPDPPSLLTCSRCTFDNAARDSHCAICESPLTRVSNKPKPKYASDMLTLGDYLPEPLADMVHFDDDIDESVQIAIILSIRRSSSTTSRNPYILDHDQADETQTMDIDPLNFTYQTKKRGKHSRAKAGSHLDVKKRGDKRSDQLRRQHKLQQTCINMCPGLEQRLNSESAALVGNMIKEIYQSKTFSMQKVVREEVVRKFADRCNKSKDDKWKWVFHGTQSKNNSGIVDRGLLVGGTKGVPVAHGSAYGQGVYCSPLPGTARGYERGSMFVCLARGSEITRSGSIWVVQNSSDILPLYLASFDGGVEFDGTSRVRKFPFFPVSDELRNMIAASLESKQRVNVTSHPLSGKVQRFVPSFGEGNVTSHGLRTRKMQRKWSAYFKINQ